MAGLQGLEMLAASPWGYVAAFVFGTLWGSFANVCIYRWPPSEQHPKGRSVVAPGSHCFACGAPVRWYDNVPLLSFLWLRGRCRDCGAGFSARYLLVEALTGLLFAVAWYAAIDVGALWEPLPARLIRFAVVAAFCFVLVVITFIDLDHQLILDKLTYPAIPIFYGLGLLLPERDWKDGLIGAALGYGIVRLVSDGYYFLTKREGLGYGDGKLLAIIGALLGWKGVIFALFGGSTLGSVIGVAAVLLARRGDEDAAAASHAKSAEGQSVAPADADPGEVDRPPSLRHTALPFGPFLAAAAVVYVFAEPWLAVRFLAVGP
jgi:leader peptidase (prepilin peptidase)/N-methyltransferase